MNDRFKFNAIVSSYYDIDTPDEYKEVEPRIYLHNVDVFSDEIGIDYDRLLAEVEKQLKLDKPEISQIMQFFEDNSNASDFEYVTIKPDKVLQSTGLKDKNGKLIYEGDILGGIYHGYIEYCTECKCFQLQVKDYGCLACEGDLHWYELVEAEEQNELEVIGNIYENKELLNENS
jgi:uncharacterized phage protein (TIGR01671 family)